MKISDLSAMLSKVTQLAGDLEVVLKAAEGEAETVITDLGIHLSPASGTAGSTLTIEHGTPPPAVVEPPAPADPPAEAPAA